jgi:hypothetical protein
LPVPLQYTLYKGYMRRAYPFTAKMRPNRKSYDYLLATFFSFYCSI